MKQEERFYGIKKKKKKKLLVKLLSWLNIGKEEKASIIFLNFNFLSFRFPRNIKSIQILQSRVKLTR